jgi:hypothetical protein
MSDFCKVTKEPLQSCNTIHKSERLCDEKRHLWTRTNEKVAYLLTRSVQLSSGGRSRTVGLAEDDILVPAR